MKKGHEKIHLEIQRSGVCQCDSLLPTYLIAWTSQRLKKLNDKTREEAGIHFLHPSICAQLINVSLGEIECHHLSMFIRVGWTRNWRRGSSSREGLEYSGRMSVFLLLKFPVLNAKVLESHKSLPDCCFRPYTWLSGSLRGAGHELQLWKFLSI